ncbi:putative toxin-antitoxin system toxin component, PIN family [Tepidimonas charontis]|uniref:Putative toxin-antitoxin system toxin component, PIN family n=1 Tax=Tepidimonas charontis TaxID=2267262 RepID=A0A554XB29_9BURK|nr:putative toxin-antitoxin system toxin component, PIN family [Tepidimonas charontis]TSE33053.1 putative toxin-antitoxin system toxin component, PIN family [Tepidimonas charontis]
MWLPENRLYDIIDDMIMRVVLDTNVLVAASRSRRGASFALMEAVRHRRLKPLASVPLMLEYEAVLKRCEHLASFRAVSVDAFLDALSLFVEPVHLHYLWRPQLRDPSDEMVLETALNGRADALVSHNLADFAAAAQRFALPVLTPGQLVLSLNQEQ